MDHKVKLVILEQMALQAKTEQMAQLVRKAYAVNKVRRALKEKQGSKAQLVIRD
jgi:hypothetical protein